MAKMNANEKREFKREFVSVLADVLETAFARKAFEEKGINLGVMYETAVGVVVETAAGYVAVDGIVKADSFDLEDAIETLVEREAKRLEAIAKREAKAKEKEKGE